MNVELLLIKGVLAEQGSEVQAKVQAVAAAITALVDQAEQDPATGGTGLLALALVMAEKTKK